MGFYFRKSINVGGIRFNFSKSGVGVSAGVKGFRVGTGPRGNYVHMGRNGLYYRSALGKTQGQSQASDNYPQQEVEIDPSYQTIESDNTATIVDASSQDLLDEINKRNAQVPKWPWALLLLLFPGIGWILAIVGALYVYNQIDKPNRKTALVYDIDESAEEEIQKFYDAFTPIMSCCGKWHIDGVSQTDDTRQYAGASQLFHRQKIGIGMQVPKNLETNVQVPCVPLDTSGRRALYFFPDRVLIYDGKKVGGLAYENLQITQTHDRFIESEELPDDGVLLGTTWLHPNNDGSPDKRYSDNREVGIMHYCYLDFTSPYGLHERIQLSRPDAGYELIEHLKEYKLATM